MNETLIKIQEILDAQDKGARIRIWDNQDGSWTDVNYDLKSLPLSEIMDYVNSNEIVASFEKEATSKDFTTSPFESLELAVSGSSRDFSKSKDLV